MAKKFRMLLAHQLPAFARDSSRSRSANVVSCCFDLTSENNPRRKTYRRSLFQLLSSQVCIAALGSARLAARESPCAVHDACVEHELRHTSSRAEAHRAVDLQFCID